MDSHEAARVLAIAAGYQKGKIAALGVLAQLLENIAVGKFPIEQFVREFDARFPSMEEFQRGIRIKPDRSHSVGKWSGQGRVG